MSVNFLRIGWKGRRRRRTDQRLRTGPNKYLSLVLSLYSCWQNGFARQEGKDFRVNVLLTPDSRFTTTVFQTALLIDLIVGSTHLRVTLLPKHSTNGSIRMSHQRPFKLLPPFFLTPPPQPESLLASVGLTLPLLNAPNIGCPVGFRVGKGAGMLLCGKLI